MEPKRTASIIVPVYNRPEDVRRSLESLASANLDDCEVIVVDDGSTDSTVAVASGFDVKVIQIGKQCGPAQARNIGAQAAVGEYLVFLDSDVRVHADTVAQLIDTLETNQDADAVFGSYDARQTATSVVSQFRNLLHHYVHQTACDQSSTFWAGCGAIRRSVFLELGGFDSGFLYPSVEDIELGMRLTREGRRIILNKQAQVTHLKRWTMRSMVSTDLFRRGVPWMRLILRDRRVPNDLNVKISQRICVALAVLYTVAFVIASWHSPVLMVLLMLSLLLVDLTDRLAANSSLVRGTTAISAICLSCTVLMFGLQMSVWSLLGLSALLGLLLINFRFYAYLARKRNRWFLVFAVPLHVVYFVVCAVSICWATVLHLASQPVVNRRAATTGLAESQAAILGASGDNALELSEPLSR